MSLEDRIDSVGRSIEILVRRLTERGFEFEHPERVCPGPEVEAARSIARIEHEVGAIPLALKLFWLRVGSVDFCGRRQGWEVHSDWRDRGYPDPLVVYPPSEAISELDEFLADKEERLRCNHPYVVPIAPDFYHKANMSGGRCYNIAVPAEADDPILNDEWHRTTFVDYLELAVQWAGFPGLSRGVEHTWPIAELVVGLM